MASRRRNSNSIFPVLLIGLGLVLIFGAVVWFINNQGGPTLAAEPAGSENQIPYSDVPRVSLADARAAYETGSAVFIDVRGEPYYSQSHIAGALSIPEQELSAHFNELEKTQWIITYCT
jgi:hypothetical protein